MWLRALVAALAVAFTPLAAPAQGGLNMGQVRSAILTIDVDRRLAETQLGRRMADEVRTRSEALATENSDLAEQLRAEERSLTERRPTMEVEEFRAEAEAFDQRVQRIRTEQDAKQRALEDTVAQGREQFLNAVTPVLARLMIDRGAVAILERRNVFLSASLVDVTEEAIAAIDAQLGDGGAGPATESRIPEGEEGAALPEAMPRPDPRTSDELDPTLAAPESGLAVPAPGEDG